VEPPALAAIEITLEQLTRLVNGELARARAQTDRLAALDADASLAYARERARFAAELAETNQRLTEQVTEASRVLAMTSFEPGEIARRYPEAGGRLLRSLRALADAASTLRRQDELNVQLAARARACVTAWLRAITGSAAAYTRQGAARELPAFSTAARVA
jgi:hypothetical protein